MMMRRRTRIVGMLAAAVGALVILGAPASASARSLSSSSVSPSSVRSDTSDFTFASYDADYYLSRNAEGHATLRTVETFVAQFPSFDQNRGIVRAIPDDYDGVPLHTTVVSVTDATGEPVHYDATDDGSFTELALGTDAFVHGRQTYVITYTQENVVRNFPDTGDDELYWDTNGTGFEQPFGTVSARVHIDPSITSFLTGNNACYRGAQGPTDTCDIAQDPDADGTVFTAGAQNLAGGENLTVVIGFTSGTFVQVPAEEKPQQSSTGFGENVPVWSTVLAIVLAVLEALAIAFAIVYRAAFGPRDAKGRGIIVPQYTPPAGLNPMAAAALLGRGSRGLSAQLVSFAVRGNLRILDYPAEKAGGDYTIQFLNADGVDADERGLLDALFGPEPVAGALCALGVRNDALARKLAAIQSAQGPRLVAAGLRVKSSARGGVFVLLALVLLLVLAIGAAVLTGVSGTFSPWLFLALPIAFVGILIASGLAVRPPVLTDAGAEARDYLLGLRDYLQLAEADRFRMLQSPQGAERIDVGNKAEMVKLYEKLLPFAVLWGIEKEWTKELAVYYDAGAQSPDWFVSSNGFNSLIFAAALSNLSSSVATTSTPTPTTSSWSGSGGGSFGGGSFGGGFSGGGGGGGGGGGR